MDIHFTPDEEAQLAEIAATAGTDPGNQEDARFRAAVREGVAQADRGKFIEEEVMDARFQQMLRS